ncbi:MAG TPA: hypothetical protein VLW84_08300 [Terriglobales bacterium]|nr:hypothetical protein [Terriglobales bacterium]
MFETERFKELLQSAVSTEARDNNLQEYQVGIIGYLQTLASQNESVLMERELRKVAGARRGIPDALNSARELTKDASKYAVAEKRAVLRLSDIEAAYKDKFCQFWPFCKS